MIRTPEAAVKSRSAPGGTAPRNVARQIMRWEKRLARAAAQATGEREPAVLDTLAWAHASMGDFRRAAALAERALALAEQCGDEALAAEIARGLERFKAAPELTDE